MSSSYCGKHVRGFVCDDAEPGLCACAAADPLPPDGSLRIVGDDGVRDRGLLQLFYYGQWGVIDHSS